jgi:hypothetical protein
MKRPVFIGIGMLAFTLGAFAQGIIDLDNSTCNYGVAIDSPGNYYTGTFGMEVWELSGATGVPAGINVSPQLSSGRVAYANMVAAGFQKEATFADQAMGDPPGTFSLGNLTMPDVAPAGSQVVLALAVWNSELPSWTFALSVANATTRAGVVAFLNPTANPSIIPFPAYPTVDAGWNELGADLVMTPVPEPGTLTLAGPGVAMLLTFRRRN